MKNDVGAAGRDEGISAVPPRPEIVCPACHHTDHDPGSCPLCPYCELHTDEALAFVIRVEPSLLRDDPLREALHLRDAAVPNTASTSSPDAPESPS